MTSDEDRLEKISPDDAKYAKSSQPLVPYLSAGGDWLACAEVQRVLLETRVEFGKAEKKHIDTLNAAMPKIRAVNMDRFEGTLRHDQLAVIEEMGVHAGEEVKALLHPGTTSYDILDTARSWKFKSAWNEVMRDKACETIDKLCSLAEEHKDVLRAGRTHLQDTSPVPYGKMFADYAARLADRVEKCDAAFGDLRGKISGIVGTGASIDMVIGDGKSMEFERRVLKKLGLKPDITASQIVQKERLADVGHAITTMMHVLGDFANDVRLLYSSGIGELGSLSSKERLGGSSADAAKDNPINWENIAGKTTVVESGMRVLYDLIASDLDRDLRGSVQARYQPQQMMAQTYESFTRASKALGDLVIIKSRVTENLLRVRKFPSEAMTAITRAHGWVHPVYGVGHSAVKEFAKQAKKEGVPLLRVALKDLDFLEFYEKKLPEEHQRILNGEFELYTGSANKRIEQNIAYARSVIKK